ncbi:LysR family transcriptional regulator [Loigolactobacillus zhaoyuanensis]|uniref:LysR family transcriptional regulator n=1 Tax=Loigolactobacillus zhaoyuanensis TaxID=2486017 RepID=A0ABW8UDM2_9LACO|nr:LysR family transcriptional regulator [Loigolactobacillus zhaoyuanensis]
MNFRDLTYFDALARLKNYTAVARQFKVTQPTITYAIKRLETELAATLFVRDRSHRQVELTANGRQLEAHVAIILHELQLAQTELAANTQQKVKFGLPPIIGAYYFPKLAQRLARHGLISHLNTTEAGSNTLLDQLRTGKLDLALLGSTSPLTDQLINAEILTQQSFKIIVSPDHPLANAKKVSFAQLIDEKFVTLKEGFVHPAALRQLTQSAGFAPNVVYTTPDISVLKSMVAENIGIGFLTALAISPADNVVALALADTQQPKFLISLAHRKNHLLSALQQELLTQLKQPIN